MDERIPQPSLPNHNTDSNHNNHLEQSPQKIGAGNLPRSQEDAVEQSAIGYPQSNLKSKHGQQNLAGHDHHMKEDEGEQRSGNQVKMPLEDKIFVQTPREYSPELIWGNQGTASCSLSKVRDQAVQVGPDKGAPPELENKQAYQQVIVIVNKNKKNNVVSLSASQPLPTENAVNYFQITILKPSYCRNQPGQDVSHQFGQAYTPIQASPTTGKQSHLASIGIGTIEGQIDDMTNSRFQAGESQGSVAIVGGNFFFSSIQLKEIDWKLKIGDTIGIGVNYIKKSMFFIHNNQVHEQKVRFDRSLFPIVTISEPGDYRFAIKFANRNTCSHLCFKEYSERSKHQQQKLKNAIWENPEFETPQLHQLVHEYLKFNGYSQTALELETEMKRNRMGQNRTARMSYSQDFSSIIAAEIEQSNNSRLNEDFQEHMGANVDVSLREHFQELLKKKRAGQEFPLEDENKKSRKMNKLKKEIKDKYQDLYENQRIRVIKHVREGKVESALRVFETAFSRLARRFKFISVFLRVHIFIKRHIQEGLSVALAYFRENLEDFQEYHHNLFPYYSTDPQVNKIAYKPLRQVLFLVCEDKRHQFDFQRQLEVFSEFLNEFLCRKCGFLERSSLEYAVAHYHTVKLRCQQIKIPLGFKTSEL